MIDLVASAAVAACCCDCYCYCGYSIVLVRFCIFTFHTLQCTLGQSATLHTHTVWPNSKVEYYLLLYGYNSLSICTRICADLLYIYLFIYRRYTVYGAFANYKYLFNYSFVKYFVF